MKYIIYKTTNILNNHYYIGVHKVNGTKYLGSGVVLKQAIKKYGKNNFVRETLKEFSNKKDAFEYEKLLVTQELVNDPSCYNITLGGLGGNPPNHTGKTRSQETKIKMSNSMMGKNKGKHHPCAPSTKVKISDSKKGTNNPMYGVCGKNAPRAKSCVIHGIKYNTVLEASIKLNKQRKTIRSWCNNPTKTDCYFNQPDQCI